MVELEQAKKKDTKLKRRRQEIDQLKASLNKLNHENDFLKRLVFESKIDIKTNNQDELDIIEGLRSDSKLLRDSKDFKDKANSSMSSTEDLNKCDVEVQTDNLRKRDNFAQTDKHGYIKLVNMIEMDKHITHTLSRKLSSKTAIEF